MSFGKAYIVSLLLLTGAIVLAIFGQYTYAAAALTIAFFPNVSEVKSHSTWFQFVNYRVITLLLGFCIDKAIGNGTYWYTLMMGVMSMVGTLRLEWFRVLMIRRFVWIEAILLPAWYALYVFAGIKNAPEWIGWVCAGLPLLFMTYIFQSIIFAPWKYERGPRPNKLPTEIGAEAPDFELKDVNGNTVRLSDFRGKNHVLLVFVRGDWCPTCHIMIREYEINRDKFVSKGIIPIGIGPDSTEVNKQMMERLGWKNMLLSDEKQEVATRYGLLFMGNNVEASYETGIALPASFLICSNGIVRHVTRSDRAGEFLSPALIFPVIEQLT